MTFWPWLILLLVIAVAVVWNLKVSSRWRGASLSAEAVATARKQVRRAWVLLAGTTIVLVEHVMRVVTELADRLVVLDGLNYEVPVWQPRSQQGAAPRTIDAAHLSASLNLMNERVMVASLSEERPGMPEEDSLDALVHVWVTSIYGQLP